MFSRALLGTALAALTSALTLPACSSDEPLPACIAALPDAAPPIASAASSCPSNPGTPERLATGTLIFVDAPGSPRVSLELAETEAERELGLMYRTTLPSDAGMLFVFDDTAVRQFWMRDTCIPLDMLFIAPDETIAGILEQVPPLNDAERSVPCPARWVLELNAGWSAAHGVRPGQRVQIDG